MTEPQTEKELMTALNGIRMNVGRHKGELFTRIPLSYLKWMVNTHHTESRHAEMELKRRGTTTPLLDISGHAIDRASQRHLKIWRATRKENEGLHSWLMRMSTEALQQGQKEPNDRYRYMGMTFVFQLDTEWPVLVTVMPDNKGKR